MGALGSLLLILLFYLVALICGALAFRLAVKKLETEPGKAAVILTVITGAAAIFAIAQAVVTVWNNAAWILHMPEIFA